MSNKNLLVVAHTPSANSRALTDAVLRGAGHADITGVSLQFAPALAAMPDDVLRAHAIILGTTENFGYMSGGLKDFFDRIYYPCLEHTQGLPYAVYIRAGNDGRGAQTSIERIVTGLRWKQVHETVIGAGAFRQDYITACEELGMTIAAGLETGIY
jgi:multimeric flavodoxin WrbA